MGMVEPKPDGWYLGLRYMRGEGYVARVPEKIGEEGRGAAFLFADSVLLKTEIWREVLLDWWQALAVGGFLILCVPDCRYGGDEEVVARVTLPDVEHALDGVSGWCLREADLIDGNAFVVWEKRKDDKQWRLPWRKQPKHLVIGRTGAYGDALMAASCLPRLKEEGWHITFVTKAIGAEILRCDPHIDELVEIGDGQVSEEEMPFYWRAWERRVDWFVNLTHSVEGELLKRPERGDYFWSDEQRRRLCGGSYLAQVHRLANVGGPYRVRFYASEKEESLARKFAGKNGPFLLWCLRGSAVHKWWPFVPEAVCQILANTDLNIVLTGGADARDLVEPVMAAVRDYYGDTARVSVCVGTHSIRDICALARVAEIVVGPETGVMNAVSMEKMRKLVLLSHSDKSNLTDDWVNAEALCADVGCYPCHRMHFDHTWCGQDEKTGAALCAAGISVRRVVAAVRRAVVEMKERKTDDFM